MRDFPRQQRVGNRRALKMGSLATIVTHNPGGLDNFSEEIRDSAKNYTPNSSVVNRRSRENPPIVRNPVASASHPSQAGAAAGIGMPSLRFAPGTSLALSSDSARFLFGKPPRFLMGVIFPPFVTSEVHPNVLHRTLVVLVVARPKAVTHY